MSDDLAKATLTQGGDTKVEVRWFDVEVITAIGRRQLLDGLENYIEKCPVGMLAPIDAFDLRRLANTIESRLAEEKERKSRHG